jgi:phage shock protein PspC (stress-responsive transcriptional regulator)
VDAVRERLYRSRSDRILFGVAGGLAEWMDIDPSVVRLVWALLVVFGGAGIILYIIAAIVIPEEPYELYQAGMAPAGGTGEATGGPGEAEPGGAPGTTTGSGWSHADARAARRAARAARRAERGNSAGIVFGLILILVGGWFLVKAYVPALDDRWLWPGIIVAIGLLLVVAAIRRPAPPSA